MPPPPRIIAPGAAYDYNPGVDAAWAAGWTQAEARQAIDAWDLGSFLAGYQLGRDVTRYAPIRAAVVQRTAPPLGIPWHIEGRFDRGEAEELFISQIEPILGETLHDLALYNFTVWQHPIEWDADAQRWICRSVDLWPLAAVGLFWVDSVVPRGYHARVRPDRVKMPDGEMVNSAAPLPVYYHLPPPGQTDGQFTFVGSGRYPHLLAPIRCLGGPYVGGEMSERDRMNLSKAIGRTAPIGVMPQETPVAHQIAGVPEPVGTTAMEKVVADLGTARAGAVIPHGADVKSYQPATGEAALFSEWLNDRIKLVALAIMGRGGALAKTDAQYPSPIEADVPESIVRADVGAIVRAGCGLFGRLWSLNRGERRGAPVLVGPLLDRDADQQMKAQQEREQVEAEKLAKFHAAVKAERENGFDFPPTPEGQARLNAIAARCGVVAPTIPPGGLPPVLVKVPPSTVPITGEDAAPLPTPPPP